MDARFWVDTLSVLLQLTAAFYMTYRYIKANHLWLRIVGSAAMCLGVYLLTDGMLPVRAVAGVALLLVLVLTGSNIPKINAIIYIVLSLFLMFVLEFPMDLMVLLPYPDFVSLQRLPLPYVLVIRIVGTSYIIFDFYLSLLICNQMFHIYTAPSVKRYLPLFLLQALVLLALIFLNGLAMNVGAPMTPFSICSSVIVVFLITMDFMLMRTFEQMSRLHELELEQQQTELLLKSEAENYSRLQAEAQVIRRLRHDMLNQLQSIRILLDGGHTDMAARQLDSYFSEVKQWGDGVFSGNAVVDAIINAKEYLFGDYGICFHYQGQLPAHIDLDAAGLSGIVANLLDNAIHACAKLAPPRRRISFSAHLHGSELLISCSNPTDATEAPVPASPDLSSEHGWGLTILQRLAERYSGHMKLSVEQGTYRVSIWIPLDYDKEPTK